MFAQKVLGGNREGFGPVVAQYKEHGVQVGIQGEVGSILRGRPWLEPREGQAATRILRGEGPMIRGVAV